MVVGAHVFAYPAAPGRTTSPSAGPTTGGADDRGLVRGNRCGRSSSGLLFVVAYARRAGPSAPPARPEQADDPVVAEERRARSPRRAPCASPRRPRPRPCAGRRQAEAEATRRAARAEADSARSQAETALAQAREQAEELLAEARRAGHAEAAKLTEELQRQRNANAERVRPPRRDRGPPGRPRERGSTPGSPSCSATPPSSPPARRRWRRGPASSTTSAPAVQAAEAQRLRELERVAGLSADDAKAELIATVESGARREAAAARPHHRERGPRRGHRARPRDRRRGRAAGRELADRRDGRSACCTCPPMR